MTRDSILSDLVALPPGKLPDDKYYVGFFRGETLLAQMDLIADYPERAMAYIGLFMMEASVQQAGIGTRGRNPHRAALLGEGQPAGRAFLEKKSVCADQRNTEHVGTNGGSGRTEVEINAFL